jgi:hypothetical protein
MSVLRAAIIGGGHIADQNHLPALASLPDRVKAISICSRDIHKAQALADKHGVPFAYDSPDDMYRSEGKPDIVINCTANNLHYPFTMQALENGCHVFCEKPPAMNAREAREMADLAKKKGLVLAYNFQRRHAPEYTTLSNYHALGNLGDIYHIKANYLRRRGIPGWGNFTQQDHSGRWCIDRPRRAHPGSCIRADGLSAAYPHCGQHLRLHRQNRRKGIERRLESGDIRSGRCLLCPSFISRQRQHCTVDLFCIEYGTRRNDRPGSVRYQRRREAVPAIYPHRNRG